MTNTKPCGTCEHYWALEQGLKNGKRRTLKQGYCLEQTTFAENKPGSPVYPPRAKVAFLKDAVHKVTIVSSTEVKSYCGKYKAGGK